jgi:hypothetical protein
MRGPLFFRAPREIRSGDAATAIKAVFRKHLRKDSSNALCPAPGTLAKFMVMADLNRIAVPSDLPHHHNSSRERPPHRRTRTQRYTAGEDHP